MKDEKRLTHKLTAMIDRMKTVRFWSDLSLHLRLAGWTSDVTTYAMSKAALVPPRMYAQTGRTCP